MAVIHIPEEEALKNFGSVLTQFDGGDEIIIDRPSGQLTLVASRPQRPLTFAEAIARLPENSTGVTDEDFLEDAMNFRKRHPESLNSSKWD